MSTYVKNKNLISEYRKQEQIKICDTAHNDLAEISCWQASQRKASQASVYASVLAIRNPDMEVDRY